MSGLLYTANGLPLPAGQLVGIAFFHAGQPHKFDQLLPYADFCPLYSKMLRKIKIATAITTNMEDIANAPVKSNA